MANVLLKNVTGTAPTQLFITGYVSSGSQFPLSITFPIQDSAGNPIDATAGTVSANVFVQKTRLSTTGAPNSDDLPTNLGTQSVDLSVAGQATLNISSSGTVDGIIGNWQLTVQATDSAGGDTIALATGNLNMVQIAG